MPKYISGYFNELSSTWRTRWGSLLALCKRNLRTVKCAYTYCTGPWLLLDLEFRNYGSDNLGIPLTYRLNLDHSVYERSLNHTVSIWSISHTFQKMKVQCINISRCWQCHPLKKAHLSKWPQKRSPKTGYMHRSTAVIRTGNGELGQPIHTCVTKWPAVEIVTGRRSSL